MKYIVYLTTNKINGKIYIGKHKTLNPDVFDNYLGCGCYANRPSTFKTPNTAFQCAVNKYGPKNFERKTLFIFDTEEEAFKKEAEIVDATFIKQPNNYNMIIGGGSSPTTEYIKVLYLFNKKGECIKQWDSAWEVIEYFGISSSSVYNAINTKESLKGFFWAKLDNININEYSKGLEPIRVYRYEKSGKLINIYTSLSEAAKDINRQECNIQIAIKYQLLVEKEYYYSTILFDEFKPSPRKSLRGCKYYLYNTNGEYLKEFQDSEELRNYFNLKSWAVLSKAINYSEGYYKEFRITTIKYDKVEPFESKKQNKEVNVYNKDGEFIKSCNSERLAAREFNCRISQINRVLRGVAKTTNGYIFKWKVNDIV